MVSVFIRGSLVPLVTPDEKRGRVMAVENVFIGASNELGAFESGLVGQAHRRAAHGDRRRPRHHRDRRRLVGRASRAAQRSTASTSSATDHPRIERRGNGDLTCIAPRGQVQ